MLKIGCILATFLIMKASKIGYQKKVKMDTMNKSILILAAAVLIPAAAGAQQTLTLADCRDMAVRNDRALSEARMETEMAGYDRKIALANYFPNVSATGTYLYNSRDIALVNDGQSAMLTNMGTIAQAALDGAAAGASAQIGGAMTGAMTQLMTAIQSNPALAKEYMSSPMWQTILGMVQKADLSGLQMPSIADPVNAIGQDIDNALHPDLHNVIVGAVTLQQPVFVGGKIIYSNQMAALAEELSEARYDMKYADIILDVDQAYWQIVSIAAKKQLAESYAGLLHQLEKDVNLSVDAGIMTESDALQIKVKANEADMMKTKAGNGLTLAKMLLCKRIGLPLDTDIRLADEGAELIALPEALPEKPMEQVLGDRPETRSLGLATRIYDKKAKIARADLMPRVALTANYLVSNPNLYNGFQKEFGGMWNAGVLVNVPLFHGFEAQNKYRKAKAEERIYQEKYDDACEMIRLQVTRERKLFDEACEKITMTENNLASAEENLRMATLGFEAGTVDTHTVLGAQTAWLQAHSEAIDAGIELQMAHTNLLKAQGGLSPVIEK